MKKISTLIIISAFLFYQGRTFAQNTGINTNGATPDVSAMLDVDVSALAANNKKGLLIPRVALISAADATTIPTPATSLLVYCTGTGGLSPAGYYYNSGTSGSPAWVQLIPGGGNAGTEWLLAGNTLTGTLPSTPNEWIGTTNAADFLIKTATITQLRVRSTGTVFITNDVSIADNSVPNERLRVLDGTGNRTAVGIVNNVLTTGTALNISSTSTGPGGAITQTDKLINLARSGANSFASHTSYGIYSSVANTGATSTDIAGYFTSSGATNNYAIIVPSGGGSVGIGTSAPTDQLQITQNFQIPATTSTTGIINQGGNAAANRFIHTYGTGNLFIGLGAGNFTTTGSGFNVGIGTSALASLTTVPATDNTAVGYQASMSDLQGSANVAIGYQALRANDNGSQNTAVGAQALLNNIHPLVNQGAWNTATGTNTLNVNTIGTYNSSYGCYSDVGSNNLNNATAIGSNAICNASTKVRLGDATVTVVEGQVAYTFPSDGRFKFNVKEEVKGLEFIVKLRPVTYQFDTKKFDQFLMKNMPDSVQRRRIDEKDYIASTNIIHSGFIAQEVEKSTRECSFTFDGISAPKDENGNYGVAYSQFVVPLVKAVQELNSKNEEQQKIIEELQREINSLKDKTGGK